MLHNMLSRIPYKISIGLAFVFSMVCAMLSGIDLSYNVYALPLKERFNFTQTQVEIVFSMGAVGIGLSVLEPLCVLLFGYKQTFLLVAVGMPLSCVFYAVAVYYGHVFHNCLAAVSCIQLLLSATGNIGYILVSKVFVEFFPRQYTGKLVSVYMAACCFGKIIFALQMDLFFKDNLVGFFLSLSFSCALGYGVCFLFLVPFAVGEVGQTNLPENGSDESKTQNNRANLHSPFLHILFWSSVTFSAAIYTCVNNITAIVQSLGMANPLYTVYLLSVVIFSTRITFGIVFDKFKSLWCGFIILMIMYFCLIFALIAILFTSSQAFIYMSVIGIGVGQGMGFATPVSIIVVRTGSSHYSVVASFYCMMTSTLGILMQIMMGFLYDGEKLQLSMADNTCYGIGCFQWAFAILLCLTVVIIVIQSINFLVSACTEPVSK